MGKLPIVYKSILFRNYMFQHVNIYQLKSIPDQESFQTRSILNLVINHLENQTRKLVKVQAMCKMAASFPIHLLRMDVYIWNPNYINTYAFRILLF